jgi:hypothetical protein
VRVFDEARRLLQNQSLPEFAILGTGGIGLLVFMVLMLTDYRGFLTNYTHQCWLYYQRSWYQRIFRWSVNRRRLYADEAVLRRHFRVMAIPGIVMGLFFVTVEFAALITGHVA